MNRKPPRLNLLVRGLTSPVKCSDGHFLVAFLAVVFLAFEGAFFLGAAFFPHTIWITSPFVLGLSCLPFRANIPVECREVKVFFGVRNQIGRAASKRGLSAP